MFPLFIDVSFINRFDQPIPRNITDLSTIHDITRRIKTEYETYSREIWGSIMGPLIVAYMIPYRSAH